MGMVQAGMRILSPFVLVFAVLLVCAPWLPLEGQRRVLPPVEGYDLGEIGHRVDAIERLDLQRRLTVLETIQAEGKEEAMWHKGSSVGVGLLLAERALLMVMKRKSGEKG